MNPRIVPMGPLATNGYFYRTQDLNILFDPGATTAEMLKVLDDFGEQVDAVLLTHGHIDHIMGLAGLVQRFAAVPIYLHRADLPLYQSAGKQAALFGLPFDPLPENLSLFSNEDSTLLGLQVLSTPGHSPGSVCFYDPANQTLFSGDTLFNYGVGRTDLWGGSWEQLEISIKTKLFTLAHETRVFSGHGPSTTIGAELKSNPFVTGLSL